MQRSDLTIISTKKRYLLSAAAIALCLTATSISSAYEGQTEIDFLGGYSAMYRQGGSPPLAVGSASFGVGMAYHLTESIGLGLELNYDRQAPFKIYEYGIIQGQGEEEDVAGWIEVGTVDFSSVKSATLSAIYAIDVMRVVPYFALGASIVQTYQRSGEEKSSGLIFGGRMNLGADYLVCQYLGLGLVFQNDLYFIGSSDFQARISFLFKISFILEVSKFGIRLAGE